MSDSVVAPGTPANILAPLPGTVTDYDSASDAVKKLRHMLVLSHRSMGSASTQESLTAARAKVANAQVKLNQALDVLDQPYFKQMRTIGTCLPAPSTPTGDAAGPGPGAGQCSIGVGDAEIGVAVAEMVSTLNTPPH